MRQLLKNKLKEQKGFTLIELLAVIVILGILAAIAIPSIGNVIDNSKRSAIRADALQIISSAQLYVAENGAPSAALTSTELADLVNQTTFPASGTTGAYSVTVTNGVYTFSGKGTKDSKVITFTNATVGQIDKAAKNATAIPAQ
jgi:type IV pilus assembly protein PilA